MTPVTCQRGANHDMSLIYAGTHAGTRIAADFPHLYSFDSDYSGTCLAPGGADAGHPCATFQNPPQRSGVFRFFDDLHFMALVPREDGAGVFAGGAVREDGRTGGE